MPISKSCFGGLFLINDNDSQHKFLVKYGKEDDIEKLYKVSLYHIVIISLHTNKVKCIFVNNIHICIILYDYTILKYVCCIMLQDKKALNRYISIVAAYKIKVIK